MSLITKISLHTQCAQVPQAVIDGSDLATVLGMADLGQENWGGHLGQTVAEAKEQATGDVHCELRSALFMRFNLIAGTYFRNPCRMRRGIHP